MTEHRTAHRYATRSGAVRAARAACRKALNSPIYAPFEGHDYEIHPDGQVEGYHCRDSFYFILRGPAKDAVASQ